MTEQPHTTADINFDTASDQTNLQLNLANETGDEPSVDIQIEKIAERQRQITAKIHIPQPVEHIWKVLTDYEALVDFIPNLAKSRLLEHPDGGIRLEQVGSQRLLNFNFCARVVLDLQESFPQEIKFCMVEGDFKGFSGSWCLEPDSFGEMSGTNLCYTIQVWPKLTMPITIIENRLSKDLRLNLLAIYQRVNQLANQC
ncbi:cyclase/dehydrase [Calothrix sp. NIES-2100]|uniref:SRPBCC family protein n=1 Tax=Calothrix sp. NIES-2100 TaxID=1954172 RepID=UPI000B5DE4B8|nr:cyclase/dehydrase [Calothrix sp. NIES-2100]